MPIPLLIFLIVGLVVSVTSGLISGLRRNPNLKPPKPDYARINSIERALGFTQSDYRAFGTEPVDTGAICIAETAECLKTIEHKLLPPIEKEIEVVPSVRVVSDCTIQRRCLDGQWWETRELIVDTRDRTIAETIARQRYIPAAIPVDIRPVSVDFHPVLWIHVKIPIDDGDHSAWVMGDEVGEYIIG